MDSLWLEFSENIPACVDCGLDQNEHQLVTPVGTSGGVMAPFFICKKRVKSNA